MAKFVNSGLYGGQCMFFLNLKFLPINKFNKHLQDPVTWYRTNYAGTQVTQWEFQNKRKSGWTGTSYFVLEDPLYNLCPSIINSVPCYCFVFFSLMTRKKTSLCYVITCHKLSLQIAPRETSDKLKTFGRIFMYQERLFLPPHGKGYVPPPFVCYKLP